MKITTLLAGAAVALGLATSALAEDKTKVGFVYVGPVGDGGWTFTHDQGRLAVEEEFGDAVETVFVESVPEGPDAERVNSLRLSYEDKKSEYGVMISKLKAKVMKLRKIEDYGT